MNNDLTVEVFSAGKRFGTGHVTEVRIDRFDGFMYGKETTTIKAVIERYFEPNPTTEHMRNSCNTPVRLEFDCGYGEEKIFNTKPDMNETFFMNYMEGQSAPTCQFTSQEDALQEAARLSATHRQSVYTLKAVIKTKPKHDVERTELKEKALTEKAGE